MFLQQAAVGKCLKMLYVETPMAHPLSQVLFIVEYFTGQCSRTEL